MPRARQHGVGDDRLAKDRGRLGQRHRRQSPQRRLAGQAFVVEGVSQLVRDGEDLIERTVKIAENARLLYAGDAHAECAALLAIARLGVNPAVVESALGQVRQPVAKAAELPDDERLCFRPGVNALASAGRREQIPPRQGLFAQALRFCLQITAEGRERVAHRAEHRIECFLVNTAVVQRRVERVPPSAPFV